LWPFSEDQLDQGSKNLPKLLRIKRLRWSTLFG
jgi:hypothetical protein